MADRRVSRQRHRYVLSPCVMPTYMNGLETMALTEKKQKKVQVCKNNLVRIIVGIKRADRRK